MPATLWELGNTIRSARMRKGYTQERLAEMLGISPGHLKQMESGKRKPSVPLLFQMMELLDFSVDALVFPAEEREKVIHVNGLSDDKIEALSRLVDTMKD